MADKPEEEQDREEEPKICFQDRGFTPYEQKMLDSQHVFLNANRQN